MGKSTNQIFLFFFFLWGPSSFFAQQIILTAADMPKAGLVITNRSIDSNAAAQFNPGSPGAEKTWDFSKLTPAMGKMPSVTTFLLPGSTPYGTDFLQAELASLENPDGTIGFTYFQSDASQFSLWGVAEKSFQIRLSKPLIVFKFPVAYQNKFVSKADATLTDQLAGEGTISDTTLVDAWGTIATPLGSFPCMRVKRITWQNFVIGGEPYVSKALVYEWWTNQYKSPVFTYTNEYYTFFGETITDISAEYLVSQTSGLRNPGPREVRIEIAPNPTVDFLTLKLRLDEPQNADLSVYDVWGRLVKSADALQLPAGESRHPVDVNALAPGIYIAVLRQSNRVLGLQQFVITAR